MRNAALLRDAAIPESTTNPGATFNMMGWPSPWRGREMLI